MSIVLPVFVSSAVTSWLDNKPSQSGPSEAKLSRSEPSWAEHTDFESNWFWAKYFLRSNGFDSWWWFEFNWFWAILIWAQMGLTHGDLSSTGFKLWWFELKLFWAMVIWAQIVWALVIWVQLVWAMVIWVQILWAMVIWVQLVLSHGDLNSNCLWGIDLSYTALFHAHLSSFDLNLLLCPSTGA